MGADSAGVSGLDLQIRRDPKLFRVGAFLIGFTSSFRMGQLLGFRLEPLKRDADEDVFRYMATSFVDAVRTCLKAGGYAETVNGRESAGSFLVGHAGRIFHVHDDFQVAESVRGYDACGSGAAYALGALRSTVGWAPDDRVRNALESAEAFSAGVRAPFATVSL